MDGLSNAEKIQAVINTLAMLNLPSMFDNTNKMLGIYRTLFEVRNNLAKEEEDDGAEDHAG